jgi:hypothetical protein
MQVAWFLIFSIAILCIVALVFLIQVPIMIARGRGISGSELTTISVLSWCGIFLGVTWLIALVLALVWRPEKWIEKCKDCGAGRHCGCGDERATSSAREDVADKIEKLHSLKKRGIITAKEFESEKKKILK